MSDQTKIEWTDATWNPITRCSVVSPGCKHCYAMKLAGTRLQHHPSRQGLTVGTESGPVWTGDVRLNKAWLAQPLAWKRARRIFVCAHGDLFHESVPDEWIDQVFAVMALAPQHTFQVLTKRPARMRNYIALRSLDWRVALSDALPPGAMPISKADIYRHLGLADKFDYDPATPAWPLPNVWLGVSVEDQKRADERIPDLLATPAAVRFLSCEPLLGAINLRSIKAPRYPDEAADSLAIEWHFDALEVGDYYWFDEEDGGPGDSGDGPYRENRIDWVIVGGESGPNARPTYPEWVRSLRDQCSAATLHCDDAPVPFFFKQHGEWIDERMATAQHCAPGPEMFDRFGSPKGNRWYFYNSADRIGDAMIRIGKKSAGRLLDGIEHSAFPEVRS